MDRELLELIVKVVLAVVGTILTYYVVPLLKSSVDSKKWNDIMQFVKKCVEAAEKKYTAEEWREKKLYVMTLVANYCESKGFPLTTEDLDALIEGFVKEVKG